MITIGLPKAAKLCLIHRGEDVFVDWSQLRFFDGEGRIEILNVEDMALFNSRYHRQYIESTAWLKCGYENQNGRHLRLWV